jgi:hypothetical protein
MIADDYRNGRNFIMNYKKDQFHDRESQVHRRLAVIVSSLPEEQEEPEVLLVEKPEEENSIISDSSATFVYRKVKIK